MQQQNNHHHQHEPHGADPKREYGASGLETSNDAQQMVNKDDNSMGYKFQPTSMQQQKTDYKR